MIALSGALAFASSALALDQLRKRAEVDFGDVPCIQRVVRNQDPVFHFDWSIEEEVMYPIPEDEPAQSRRFQFLAVNQQNAGKSPEWISQADIDAVHELDATIGDPSESQIWEKSPNWPAESWFRVTPDDMRIEVTFAAADEGADWDTSGVPVGAYQVLGYTWDPPINITAVYEGLIKVVDDADDVGGPALYLEPWPEGDTPVVPEGALLELDICVDGPAETSIRAFIARPNPNARSNSDFEWVEATVSGYASAAQGNMKLSIEIPELGVGTVLEPHRVRIDVEDQEGNSYTAISPRYFQVSEGEGNPPLGETGGDHAAEGGSGGCNLQGPAGTNATCLALLSLLFWRRRRFMQFLRKGASFTD